MRHLVRLDKPVAERILEKLNWLAENANTLSHIQLTGSWSGFYKACTGDYRAIYRLDFEARVLPIQVIGHRREMYDE